MTPNLTMETADVGLACCTSAALMLEGSSGFSLQVTDFFSTSTSLKILMRLRNARLISRCVPTSIKGSTKRAFGLASADASQTVITPVFKSGI